MRDFFLDPFLSWVPIVFYGTIFILVSWNYFFENRQGSYYKISFFIILTICFRIVYALSLSAAQYYIWSSQEFTKLLLPPHQPVSYFLGYAFLHFWLEQLLVIAGALVFYIVLTLLRKYKKSLISREEILLGFLIALLVSWPSVVIFIPLVFVLSIFISVAHMLFLKENRVSLDPAFVLAGLITLIWGNMIIGMLHLTVLRV